MSDAARLPVVAATFVLLISLWPGVSYGAANDCSARARVCAEARKAEGRVDLTARDAGGLDEVSWGGNTARDPSRCTFSATPGVFDQEVDPVEQRDIPRNARWYVRNCGGSDQYLWYVPRQGGEVPDPVVALLAAEAVASIEPSVSGLVTSPPLGSPVLTGLPMYLAVADEGFEELSGQVSAGQFSVSARVVPVGSWFVPGDHDEVGFGCEGSGSVWSWGQRPSEADCTYTFTHVPAHLGREGEGFELRWRVRYAASYTVSGPVLAGSYELGEFDGPEGSVVVPVAERRAVRVGR